jgi:hypothetical protein
MQQTISKFSNQGKYQKSFKLQIMNFCYANNIIGN